MKVYRLCRENEITNILKNKNFNDVGTFCRNGKVNTHNYNENIKYLHFFKNKEDLLYLNMSKDRYICVYDIPENILVKHNGIGKYLDYIKFYNLNSVQEFAIPSSFIKFEYLQTAEKLIETIDFEDFFEDVSLTGLVHKVYCKNNQEKTL